MPNMTDKLNTLVANFVKARDADGTHAGRDEAYALAEFCADIFEKPFHVRADDGSRENRVPHKSSQDVYRETWRKEGRDVSTLTLRLTVMPVDTGWYSGEYHAKKALEAAKAE